MRQPLRAAVWLAAGAGLLALATRRRSASGARDLAAAAGADRWPPVPPRKAGS